MRRAPRTLIRALAAVAIIAAVPLVSSPEDWGWQTEDHGRSVVATSQTMSNDWGWSAPAPNVTAAVVPSAPQSLIQDWGW
ncbi:hypothetical protein [Kitasatospora purpeofusca]|uniref:Secreted protein n=1 Tax=Kitasatospora purpeofusca TaxID=67352 RepID=A0ABZ1U4R3_9ACTN|nr:hypothetical protein [Kitasatospora purpeofusca]